MIMGICGGIVDAPNGQQGYKNTSMGTMKAETLRTPTKLQVSYSKLSGIAGSNPAISPLF